MLCRVASSPHCVNSSACSQNRQVLFQAKQKEACWIRPDKISQQIRSGIYVWRDILYKINVFIIVDDKILFELLK